MSKTYSFKVKNNTTDKKRLVLFPGLFTKKESLNTALGENSDLFVTENSADVTVSSNQKDINLFVEFMKHGPAFVDGVDMHVNNPEQFGNPIVVYTDVNPFGGSADMRIDPGTAQSSEQANDKLVKIREFNELPVLSNESVWVLDLLPEVTITFTFHVGDSYTLKGIMESIMFEEDQADNDVSDVLVQNNYIDTEGEIVETQEYPYL